VSVVRPALRRRYLEGIPDKIATLRAICVDLRGGRTAAEGRLRRLAHQLAGSGASYGFAEISASARRAEVASSAHALSSAQALLEVLENVHRLGALSSAQVLVIEDDFDVAVLVRKVVSDLGATTMLAMTGIAAEALLAEVDFDLVILDLMLPDVDGRDVLRSLRAASQTEDVPVVVLSRQGSPQIRAECISAGVDHFIDKPVDEALVATAVEASIRRAARRKATRRVDPLTGLPGPATVPERPQSCASLAVIDIDHLDGINLAHGRLLGDQCLLAVAGHTRDLLGPDDRAVRWAGDEIVLLLASGVEEAKPDLQLLAQRLAETTVTDGGATMTGVPVTVALVPFDGVTTVPTAVALANRLAYQARRHELGPVVVPREDQEHRILLVEDDPDAVVLARSALDDLGLVHVVANVPDALQALGAQVWSLVVLDWHLPRSTGEVVIRALRDQGRLEPVLVLSGAGGATLERALEVGADDYVAKPFAERRLLSRARRLLVRGRV